ncbi:MAG TPA: three-Cys-motif partner protein TcmP, partial [Sphingorhabdus sp.]|nr:three-Cys-motif partner protein TcmP [Sphingorhabdus sp.]
MSAQSFGDKHTVQKLETVEKYLQTYATALKYQSFELLYVDACAGSGSSVPKAALDSVASNQAPLDGFSFPVVDTDEIIVGSAIRALGVQPAFHKYLLNDVKQSNVDTLRRSIESDYPELASRVELTRLDANEMLQNLCVSHDWKKTRAVVFLDPFGLQINYETLEMLGKTQAVDVWYLVPVFAMYRQVSGDGQINLDGGPRVDAALGTNIWRNVAVV